jgi:hypothetical protein
MDDLIGKILIFGLIGSVGGIVIILLFAFRPRWFLIQHINEPRHVWAPMKLWGLPGMKPICFMFFRVWGPFKTEAEAELAARAELEKFDGRKSD